MSIARPFWEPHEDAVLLDNPTLKPRALEQLLPTRTRGAIQDRRRHHGLTVKPAPRPDDTLPWPEIRNPGEGEEARRAQDADLIAAMERVGVILREAA